MAGIKAVCCLLLMTLIGRNNAVVFDVKTRGAKADGKTDDGPAIVKAWKEACGTGPSLSTVLIPPGTYMAFPPILLAGPCKGPIEIKAIGATIKAPPELAKFTTDYWIGIRYVDRLTMIGGIFDGQGQETWKNDKCPDTALTCQVPINLRFSFVKNSTVKDVTSVNSKFFHMSFYGCDNTNLDHITINAPGNSVNTDGIDMGRLSGFTITNSNIKTGDDCVSFGDGVKNIHVEKVTCGPGHGMSIGSLGRNKNELPVQGIWIKNCTMTNTMYGVRIKTWPASNATTASDIHFEDIIMNKVGTPIFIDQEYCPGNICKKGPSKVKISNVSFKKIRGTSATKVAVKMICSKEFPCDNVEVADINLTNTGPEKGAATSVCSNVKPKMVGKNVPPACPSAPRHTTV